MIKTEWNPFEIENENRSTEPCSAREGLESIKREMDFLANGRDAPFSNPFFIELVRRIKSHLSSINNYAQISRGKFSDKEFGEYYYRVMTEDIEKIEIVLNGLMDYTKLHTPIRKMNTVHNIVEEVLKKRQVKLEEKGIKLLKRFEKGLPETVVPDEQLRYVLSSVLQYAMVVAPPDGNISVSTKSLLIEKRTGETKDLFKKDGKYLEISVIFEVHRRRNEPASETDTVQREEGPNILLRFVKEVVLRNHGIMKTGANEKRTRALISLRFPVERREVGYYQSVTVNRLNKRF